MPSGLTRPEARSRTWSYSLMARVSGSRGIARLRGISTSQVYHGGCDPALVPSHPLDQAFEARMHLGGGEVVAAAVTGEDPVERIIEQTLERAPLRRPRPAIGPERIEVAQRKVPGERIAREEAVAVPEIGATPART